MVRLKAWEDLPHYMQNEAVKTYYTALKRKKVSLAAKRIFDIVMSVILLVILSPLFLFLSIWIKLDSSGPVFFRQERVTQYGRRFRIFKFRTMVHNADKIGSQITIENDVRITGVGTKIRKVRLDEIPQLLNVLAGDMSFVGTRPEVPKYVEKYTDEMYATLLLPAGITSEASIRYKKEDEILANVEDVDKAYIEEVLPDKMKYNCKALKEFNFIGDILLLFRTVAAII
ncbi:MAG: sugar transferase [Roseburia sp.]|nr:sugar transferase [Roseburia sp.]